MEHFERTVWEERFELASERIKEIAERENLFGRMAQDIITTITNTTETADIAQTVDVLQGEHAELLACLKREMEFLKNITGQDMLWEQVIRMELFLEVYASFSYEWEETQSLPSAESVRQSLYWYAFDYADVAAEKYVMCLQKEGLQEIAGAMGESLLYDQQLLLQEDWSEDAKRGISLILDRAYISRKAEALKTAFDRIWAKTEEAKEAEDTRPVSEKGKKSLWTEYVYQMKKIVAQFMQV